MVIYIEVKRKILILCRKVLKSITAYKSIRCNAFKGRFLT